MTGGVSCGTAGLGVMSVPVCPMTHVQCPCVPDACDVSGSLKLFLPTISLVLLNFFLVNFFSCKRSGPALIVLSLSSDEDLLFLLVFSSLFFSHLCCMSWWDASLSLWPGTGQSAKFASGLLPLNHPAPYL